MEADHDKALKMSERAETVRLRRCPEYDDPRALIEHGVAAMVRVSQGGDLEMALKASEWLVEYAESLRNGKREANQEAASTVSPDESGQGQVC